MREEKVETGRMKKKMYIIEKIGLITFVEQTRGRRQGHLGTRKKSRSP